jgi:hypothetical protein
MDISCSEMDEVVRRMFERIVILTRTNFLSDSITFRLGWSELQEKSNAYHCSIEFPIHFR